MITQLTALQARVIGVLLEKEITTPDQYPLSLNSLTLGCNQKSNREPVLQLSEQEVQNVLDELDGKNLLFQQASGRVVKYKHRFCNTEFSSLKFSPQQRAIICVLLLRGPQTPGELRTRTNRLADFANVQEVEDCLTSLSDFNSETLVVKLPREPGKRESRYSQMFNPHDIESDFESSFQVQTESLQSDDALQQALERIAALEADVLQLKARLDDLEN
ncbi:YceH family protein [Glaciecola sp. 1036]|uniref:YceH family protein n=1 Tax=Alteromonadaceae TaxID=72275 RepID=UPI003D09070C